MNKLRYKLWKHFNKKVEKMVRKEKVTLFDPITFRIWQKLNNKLVKKGTIKNNAKFCEKARRLIYTHRHPEVYEQEIKSIDIALSKLTYGHNTEATISKLNDEQAKISENITNIKEEITKEKTNTEATISKLNDELAQEKAKNVTPQSWHKQLIAVQGFYYSGSSALIGLFQEFNNTTILGYPDYTYSAEKVTKGGKEVRFFVNSALFPLINSYFNANPLEQDLLIKKFIGNVNNCYINKGLYSWDKNPAIYSEEFYKNSLSFIYSILELDEHTKNCLKENKLPTAFCSADNKYEGCSFIHGSGLGQYVVYRFKKMAPEIFEAQVYNYISSFFNHLPSKDFLVCDQIFGGKYLDEYNKYVKTPAKQICIYRDPRDQFLSALRADATGHMPRNIGKFVEFYKNRYGLVDMLENKNPNRLMLRFEDLVLKYDEVVPQILDFVGIDKSCHIAPKSVFDPAISAQNIGAYKNFIDQDFMKQIEERLSEYCYYQ